MIVYVLLYGILIFSHFLLKDRKVYAIVMGAVLSVLICFRAYSVGGDTIRYKDRYDNIILMLYDEKLLREPGYTALNYFFKEVMNFDYRLFLIVTGLFIAIVTVKFFYDHSKDIYISLLMYISLGMFAMNMSGIRQTIAITIILLSFRFIEKRKLVFFIVTIYLAATFHNSAIAFIPAYFFYGIKLKKYMTPVLFLTSIAAYYIVSIFSSTIYSFVPNEYDYIDVLAGYDMNVLVFLFPIVLMSFSLIFLKSDCGREYGVYNSFFIILSCMYIGLSSMGFHSMYFTRLAMYYYVGLYIIFPNAVTEIKKNSSFDSLVVSILFSVVCILYFFISVPGGTLEIDNYKFMDE